MTLTEFLNARLNEIEATAKCAEMWQRDHHHAVFIAHYGAEWGAIDDYDPARVLREVEAKRKILILADEAAELDWTVRQDHLAGKAEWDAAGPTVGERIARAMATAWSDHPDYKQEWA